MAGPSIQCRSRCKPFEKLATPWALIVQVYVFRNIRFAAPPLGELRWSKPAPPEFIPGIQDGSYGHNCIPAPIPDQFFMPGVKNLTKNSAEGKILGPDWVQVNSHS
jgi:hypothetical protein